MTRANSYQQHANEQSTNIPKICTLKNTKLTKKCTLTKYMLANRYHNKTQSKSNKQKYKAKSYWKYAHV